MVDSATMAKLAGVFATLGIVIVVWLVLAIIASWRIFTKAGEPGWKCIVPFYNSYTMLGFT